MDDKTSGLRESFKELIEKVKSSDEIEQLRVEFLGKKGHIASLMGQLKSVPNEEKKAFGQTVNLFKQEVEKQLASLMKKLFSLRSKDLSNPQRITMSRFRWI